MKIELVGGIYGMDANFRTEKLQETTETLLSDGLIARGHTVLTDRHRLYGKPPSDVDLVHVHHLAKGCVRMLGHRKLPMIFTRHATKALPLLHSAILLGTYERADAVVALSQAELASLPHWVRLKAEVIYNGIDQETFVQPAAHRNIKDEVRLLYVGQVIQLKRVNLAVEFLHESLKAGAPARLTIVTQRSPLLGEILSMANELRVARQISIIHGIPKQKIAQLMQNHHLLVQPSGTEALSTVVSEACLTGLPVLSFDVGGMREQVPDGYDPPASTETERWLRRGLGMLQNYDYWRTVFQEHVPAAKERFAIPKMIERHIALYKRTLYSKRELE